MKKKIIISIIFIIFNSGIALSQVTYDESKIENDALIGKIFVFGFDVDVINLQLEPGYDYIDLEVLNRPLYIFDRGLFREPTKTTSGAFIRLEIARGLFHPSIPICIGTCIQWSIIG
jgi:hypothetical protein